MQIHRALHKIASTPLRRPLTVALGAWVMLELIEAFVRRKAGGDLYFQAWSSETMMQSVSLRDLHAAPFASLWYLHVQPPIHNAIRAALAALHPLAGGDPLVRRVDRDLYHVWAIAYGALAALCDAWLVGLGVRRPVAALLTLGLLLHPATLAFATLLDGTFVSALFTTWILYETWRFARRDGSAARLGAAVLCAYLTRPVFQWPFVGVMLTSLMLLAVPRRTLARFALIVGLGVGLYSAKQLCLFHMVVTSSLAGYNLARSIDARCDPGHPAAEPSGLHLPASIAVLREPLKLDGTPNLNHAGELTAENAYLECFRRAFAARPWTSLLANYAGNLRIYLQPSSTYSGNAIADRLPWRAPADRLFSGLVLIAALIAAAALHLLRAGRAAWRPTLALLLPALYVVAICVLGERWENMRFKFFLEPAAYVFLAVQCERAAQALAALAA